jgi:hypothetical protein
MWDRRNTKVLLGKCFKFCRYSLEFAKPAHRQSIWMFNLKMYSILVRRSDHRQQ